MSEEQRILCPSCHCDLLQPKDGLFGDAFTYATPQQMRERHLTCNNFSCPVYIEGQPHLLHDWVAEGEAPGDQNPQPTSQAKNDNDENRQLMTADIDNDLATTDFVNNQVIAGYDDRLQHAEIDGGWAPYGSIVFGPFSGSLGPFDNAGPFTASPGPFLGAAPSSATGQGYNTFPSPSGTGYHPVPMPVYNPVHVPATLPNASPSASPIQSSIESAGSSRQDSTQAQKPRASIRNRYTEHEIEVIMQMKAQGHSNDKIAQVLPRHTARSIEAKFAALTKGRPRS